MDLGGNWLITQKSTQKMSWSCRHCGIKRGYRWRYWFRAKDWRCQSRLATFKRLQNVICNEWWMILPCVRPSIRVPMSSASVVPLQYLLFSEKGGVSQGWVFFIWCVFTALDVMKLKVDPQNEADLKNRIQANQEGKSLDYHLHGC